MRMRLPTLGAMILIGLAAGTANAQDLSSICGTLQEQKAGSWAQYQISGSEGSGTMRMALLSEGAGGTEGTWFEMSGDFNGQSAIIQILADEWPFEADDVREMVLKAAGQPAMRMPEAMMSRMRGQMTSPVGNMAASCAQGELLGSESVEVPAGSFDAYKLKPSDVGQGTPDAVWVSTDIPFGVIKSEGSGGTMVLLDYGTDATSSIDEEPVDMPGMPGMP